MTNARHEGRRSLSVDGRMIDIPVVMRAQKVLDLATRVDARAARAQAAAREAARDAAP